MISESVSSSSKESVFRICQHASKETGSSSTETESSVGIKDSENRLLIGESDSSSSTESVCRICQLASKETGKVHYSVAKGLNIHINEL